MAPDPPSPDDFPPLHSLPRPGRSRPRALAPLCPPVSAQPGESLTPPLRSPSSPSSDQFAGRTPEGAGPGPWASPKRWADVVGKSDPAGAEGPAPAATHGTPAERPGSSEPGSSGSQDASAERPGASALGKIPDALARDEPHLPQGPREGACVRAAANSEVAHGSGDGPMPAGHGEEASENFRGEEDKPVTSMGSSEPALPEDQSEPSGPLPQDPLYPGHLPAAASASGSSELAPDKSPGQSAARGEARPRVPDLLASAQEILGDSSGPWPCRPVARRLFPAPTCIRTASLPSARPQGCRGPAGASLAAWTHAAGASLAVRPETEKGDGQGVEAARSVTDETSESGDSTAEEDAKAAARAPLQSPEPSSSPFPSPSTTSPPAPESTPPLVEEPEVTPSDEDPEAPPSSDEPEAPALPEATAPAPCTQEPSRVSQADVGPIAGAPEQEGLAVPPVQVQVAQLPPRESTGPLSPSPLPTLSPPTATPCPASPSSPGLPPRPATPPATGPAAPLAPSVIIRDRPWRKICSWRSLEAASSASSASGNPWSLSSSSCSSGTSSPMPRASPGAPGCMRHRSLPPLAASRMGARGWPAPHDGRSRSWKENTPHYPAPESPFAFQRRMRHASPGRLLHPGSGRAVSADHTEYADVSRWLWAIPDPHKAEDPSQSMVSVAAFAPFQQDQAPLYPGQPSYGDASQYGACLLALDPVFLIRLALQQQIEYYFSVANLCKDIFLRKQMDAQGFVHVSIISQFNRVRCFCVSHKFLLEVLETSRTVEVQDEHLRRRQGWEEWLLPQPSSATSVASVSEAANSSQGEADSCEEPMHEEQPCDLQLAAVHEPIEAS